MTDSAAVAVGFIGLGVMGYPMAGHLARAGHTTTVFNRTPARAAAWQAEYGGSIAGSPDGFAHVDILCLCVGRDEDVRQMLIGDPGAPNQGDPRVLNKKGALSTLRPGAIVVDHTTTSAELAREMAIACADRGISWLDAPVSGGQSGAERGQLTVMAGGDAAAFARVEPVIAAYSRAIRRMGEAGAGQLAKMVNQICIAGLVQGLAEGLHFARRAGLDPDELIGAIGQGAAQSWQMLNRYRTMWDGDYEHGFAVDWMRKDLGYALAEARGNGSTLPVTALVDQFYADVQAAGGRRWDTSSLLARLERAGNSTGPSQSEDDRS